jgi:hypothetical protein
MRLISLFCLLSCSWVASKRSPIDDASSSFDSQPFDTSDDFAVLQDSSTATSPVPAPALHSGAKESQLDDQRRLQAALEHVKLLSSVVGTVAPSAPAKDKANKAKSTLKPAPLSAVVDCRGIEDVPAATVCIGNVRALPFSCADVDELRLEPHPFAYSGRKILFRARWREHDVVVKRPRKAPAVKQKFSADDDWRLFRDEAFVFAALVADVAHVDADSLLDAGGRMRLAPHFFGMCLQPQSLMTVFEPATTLEQYRRTHELSLTDAAAVAAALVNVARYLAHQTPLGPLVHCDIHHRQVAFVQHGDRQLAVLSELDDIRPAPFQANSSCAAAGALQDGELACDKGCFKAFHYSDFAQAASARLQERLCGAEQQCRGFDASLNTFTFAGYLLWELFLRPASVKMDLEFVTLLADVVARARALEPGARGDIDAVSRRLAQFVAHRKLQIGFRPLTAEMLAPFVPAVAADDENEANVEHMIKKERDADRDAKHNARVSTELVASLLHLLHPIQADAALRSVSLRERAKLVEQAARDESRFVDADTQRAFIVSRLGEQALPTPAPVRKTKAADATPAPRALSPAELREAAQRAQMARIQLAREQRDRERQHQLATGLRVGQPRQPPGFNRQQ